MVRTFLALMLAMGLLNITPSSAGADTSVAQPIIAFGDSITWGANAGVNSVLDYQDTSVLWEHQPGATDTSYPAFLGRRLHRTVYDYGYPGMTTQSDRSRLDDVLNTQHPATVLLMEGANDLLGGRSVDDTIANLRQEVDLILSSGARCVLLTGTPLLYPSDDPRAWLAPAMGAYNVAIRQLAVQEAVPLVDVERVFLRYDWDAKLTQATNGANDYIHPNDAGDAVIAYAIATSGVMG